MTAILTITLSDEVLEALRANKSIRLNLGTGRGGGGGPAGQPRDGSLPARLLAWAEKRGRPFGTADVMKHLKVSRAHASMLTSRLANGPWPIDRPRRGVYVHASANGTSKPKKRK